MNEKKQYTSLSNIMRLHNDYTRTQSQLSHLSHAFFTVAMNSSCKASINQGNKLYVHDEHAVSLFSLRELRTLLPSVCSRSETGMQGSSCPLAIAIKQHINKGIMKAWDFLLKISSQNQFNIYFLIHQYILWHSQAQTCLQISHKPFPQDVMNYYQFLMNAIF